MSLVVYYLRPFSPTVFALSIMMAILWLGGIATDYVPSMKGVYVFSNILMIIIVIVTGICNGIGIFVAVENKGLDPFVEAENKVNKFAAEKEELETVANQIDEKIRVLRGLESEQKADDKIPKGAPSS